jgi:hypothetical protein
MKLLKVILTCIWILYIGTFIYGFSRKQEYIDVGTLPVQEIFVAQVDEEMLRAWAESAEAYLKTAPIIAKVLVTGDIEHEGFTSKQRVIIKEVYKGEISTGNEVYITSSRWGVVPYKETYALSRGFINILNRGEEYLVFLDSIIDIPGQDNYIISCYDEGTIITPIFAYSDKTHYVGKMDGMSTYTQYAKLRENEFFCTTEEGFKIIEDVKRSLLEDFQ